MVVLINARAVSLAELGHLFIATQKDNAAPTNGFNSLGNFRFKLNRSIIW